MEPEQPLEEPHCSSCLVKLWTGPDFGTGLNHSCFISSYVSNHQESRQPDQKESRITEGRISNQPFVAEWLSLLAPTVIHFFSCNYSFPFSHLKNC